MLAVARDDFIINVVDIDTREVVRKFFGHLNKITDMVRESLCLSFIVVVVEEVLRYCHGRGVIILSEK